MKYFIVFNYVINIFKIKVTDFTEPHMYVANPVSI
jgi:hypothetical protein